MILRLLLAAGLGLMIGIERESIGKEAGPRTDMVVCVSAAIFTIIGLVLPYVIATPTSNVDDIIARNSGFLTVIANIAIGISFLGAGVMVREGVHVRSITTAATIWFAASIGVLCGIGLYLFATIATVIMIFLLVVLRYIKIPYGNEGKK